MLHRRVSLLLLTLLCAVIPTSGRASFAQSGCQPVLYQGFVNSCSGLSVRFLNRNSIASIDRFEARWLADGVIQTLPAAALSASRQTGCNFASHVTITQFLKTGASCSITSAGSAPHSFPCDLCASQQGSVSVVSAANFGPSLTADSIAAAFADGDLTTQTQSAFVSPLPFELAGVRVTVAGQACGLFYASPRQVNFHVPPGAPLGLQPVQVFTPQGQTFNGSVYIAENAPSLFTFSGDGQGAAAAYYLELGPLYAILFGQGVGVRIHPDTIPTRGASVKLILGDGQEFDAFYAGPSTFIGLQQFNFALPPYLLPFGGSGIGAVLRVCVDGGARCWNSNGVTLRR